MNLYTHRGVRRGKGSWSSGYDVALTQRRSPVRIRPSPLSPLDSCPLVLFAPPFALGIAIRSTPAGGGARSRTAIATVVAIAPTRFAWIGIAYPYASKRSPPLHGAGNATRTRHAAST